MADKTYHNLSGRLVQGSVFEPQTTDMKGRPLTDKNNNPKVQYFIGVAVQKNSPEFQRVWGEIYQEGAAAWLYGECGRPDFSWKIVDGDDPKYAGRDGFAGHMIFRLSSGFPIQAVAKNAERPIANPQEIKRGYYVRVFFTVASNEDRQKPGMYLNVSIVELLGYGPEITGGPDAAAMIANAGAAGVVPGMSPTPVGGAAPAPGGYPGAPPAPAPGPPVAPPATAYPGAPAAVPGAPPATAFPGAPPAPAAPAPGGYPGAPPAPAAPAPPAPVAPPAPAPGPVAPRPGHPTYEALIAAGWTNATLVGSEYAYLIPGAPPANPAILNPY